MTVLLDRGMKVVIAPCETDSTVGTHCPIAGTNGGSFAALQLPNIARSSIREFPAEVVVFDGDDMQGAGERLVGGTVVVAFLAERRVAGFKFGDLVLKLDLALANSSAGRS